MEKFTLNKKIQGFGLVMALIGAFWLFNSNFRMRNLPHSSDVDHTQVRSVIEQNIKLGIQAPEFPSDLDWFNVSARVQLSSLRGKVVLLDFWTFCCINCIHVIPDLKFLEKKYSDELVVLGVHSAKFENERDSANIKKSILRYQIAHPVVNDHELEIWRSFGVRSWPTLILIDPEGRVVLQASGEGNREVLDSAIDTLISIFEENGKLKKGPIELKHEEDGMEKDVLRFPGKILAASARLYIADSNHNRIVITDTEGNIQEIVGSGDADWRDGSFSDCAFHNPQGMALDNGMLYVADTDNHLIRKIDFQSRTVSTVAGDGKQGHFNGNGPPLETSLSSPWDLVFAAGKLYIAMAGTHQIWVLDPEKNNVQPFAGSGREDIIDGPFNRAALAQPSGITFDGRDHFYFADSETSSVRGISLSKKEVTTLVGTGLFDFGDRVGSFGETLLQHPLGAHYGNGKLYVADTYNDVIKVFDPERKTTETLQMAQISLYEPGGLWVDGKTLYIADTNNHRIVAAGLSDKTARVIKINSNIRSTAA